MNKQLNKQLLIKQQVTPKQEAKLQKLYTKLDALMVAAGNSRDEDKPKLVKKLIKLECKLQKNWNFPQDVAYHKYQWNLPGCTCPKEDNYERIGNDMKLISTDCPYHNPKPKYTPIKVIDGTDVTIKSNNTKSVDIHLSEDDQYTNIILPNGTILVVEPDGTVTHFSEDTQVDSYKFI